MRQPRVVILTSIMAPHRIAAFSALAAEPDLDVVYVYLAETDPSRAWETYEQEMRFRYRKLRERWRVRRPFSYVHVTSGLVRMLRDLRPDVLVAGGWDQIAYLQAYGLRKVLGYKLLFWVESNLRDRRPEARVLRRAKRRLIEGADGLVVPGTAACEYVTSLGAPGDRVWMAPNAVDNERYRSRSMDREHRRGPVQVLFVGRLDSGKGVLTLLDAWSLVPSGAELTIVGDGPLRERLAARVARSPMPPVRVLGHLERDEIADRYANADIFVFPSLSDAWGLVLNEAMASGLPLVVSSAPGAVEDLVNDGRNGFVVAPLDAAGFANAIGRLATDTDLRARMGAESSSVIRGFEPLDWATGMRTAILHVLNRAA
jgi:glycosyltransferase involved in cell wall biosynthesis